MYGKSITLTNGQQSITVFVCGTPDLTCKEWEERAKALIENMVMLVN